MWHHFRDLIAQRLRQANHRPQVEGAMAINAFSRLLQSRLAPGIQSSVRATKLVDGVLTVEVEHPAISQAIRREEPSILAALNKDGHRIARLVLMVRRRSSGSSPTGSR